VIEGVKVTGLSQFVRAARDTPGRLNEELQVALAEAGELVAVRAHALIREKGLVGGPRSTGRLDRMTRASKPTRSGRVFIRSGAMNKGFNYPRVYEFGRGGQRAFLRPALEQTTDAVVSRLDRAVMAAVAAFEKET
jgi:hypothetical protein